VAVRYACGSVAGVCTVTWPSTVAPPAGTTPVVSLASVVLVTLK
jgi:hypothetical protein